MTRDLRVVFYLLSVQISMTACSFSAYGWGGGRQAGALCACYGVGLHAGSERTVQHRRPTRPHGKIEETSREADRLLVALMVWVAMLCILDFTLNWTKNS
jgi:hypothetical protein